MHATITLLTKHLSALTLALFFIAISAGPGQAQDAHQKHLRPLQPTAVTQRRQPALSGLEQGSVATAWAVANSVGNAAPSWLFVISTDGAANPTPEDDKPPIDEDAPAPLNGEGGGNEEPPTEAPPPDDYERVLEAPSVLGIAGASEKPGEAAVLNAYPNPFNPQTTLRFEVYTAQQVRLAVFNAIGQRVQVLVDGWVEAGVHEARFEAYGLPSGAYFSRLITEAGVVTRTMVLAR